MTTKKTGFENGSSGSAITTSGGNPDAFTEVVLVGTGTAKYSTTRAAHGSVSALIDAPASGDKVTIGWLSGFGSSTLSDSICMYWAAYPSAATDIGAIRNATANAMKVQLWNDGKLRVVDAGGTIIKTFASAIGTGAWVRLEYGATKGTTTSNGRIQCAFYTKDGTTATDSYDSGTTVDAGTTDLTVAHHGWLSGSSTGQYWLDSFQVQDVAPPLGPWNTNLVFELDDTVGIADDGLGEFYDFAFTLDDDVDVTDSLEQIGPAMDATLAEDLAVLGSARLGSGAGWLYPLQEQEGASSAGDMSGVPGRPKLRATRFGKSGGARPVFGVADLMPDGTCVTFTPSGYGDGYALDSGSVRSYLSTGYTVIVQFAWSGPDDAELVRIGDKEGPGLVISAMSTGVWARTISETGQGVLAAKAVVTNDGLPHVAVVSVSGNTFSLWVDLDPVAATAIPQGMGYVQGLTVGYPSHDPVSIAWVGYSPRIVDADGAALLAGLALGDAEPSDARIARAVRWLTGAQVRTEPGLSEVAYQPTKGLQALDVINDANVVEDGVFFADGAGEYVQHSRRHRYNPQVVATISASICDPADLAPLVDMARVINDLQVSTPDGSGYRARDEASIRAHGERNPGGDLTVYAADETAAEALALHRVTRYAQPAVRVARITVDLIAADAGTANKILSLEIGDRIQLVDMPETTTGGSVLDLMVEGFPAEAMSPTSWRITIATSMADLRNIAHLDSPAYGVLGTSRLAY